MPSNLQRRILLGALAVSLVPAATALAGGSTKVTLSEFKLRASPASVSAGRVTFNITNAGDNKHELVVIKTSTSAAKLPVSSGRASTKGDVAKKADIGAGRSARLTVRLKKGHYALICNIPGHYSQGMRTDFTVK